tara:strand:+ start:355 stop:741 length:387 start_codon:yes stop_codon:yes gene_type:complete
MNLKQKILSFCLKHWKEIGLVLLLLVVFGKSQYDMRNVIKAHEVSEQSLKTQIETLQSLHADELELRDEALERYRRDIEELEQQYEERQAEIANLTRAEKEVIIKEFKQDKALIAQRFIETYGLRYVE